MSTNDFFALSPLLILSGSSVLIMLLIAVKLSHRIIQLSSLLFFALAFYSLIHTSDILPYNISPLLIFDGFSNFILGLIIFASLVVNVLSYVYFDEKEESPKEYYVLLFLCTLGSCVLAISNHFISLFLGLEILTVGLYALIAYLRGRNHSIEAGVKYLVLAAFSSAFLLFGMALIYLELGSMEFAEIGRLLQEKQSIPPIFITGLGMILVGVGFKLAIVPFHMWTADIYQGAPAPVTAFIATASKGGIFAVLFRFFDAIKGFDFPEIMAIITSIAIASMLIGNLLALQQKNVKRILAYSSIAHFGYLFVAFIPGSGMGMEAISFYLLAYFITTLTAFGIVTLLSATDHDAENINTYKGLFWQHPALACILTAALLSLAGIPLTAGFIGKFYVLTAGLQGGFWLLAIILVLSSVIGLYYYLRIISIMFSKENKKERVEKKAHPGFYLASTTALSLITFYIIWLGVYPSGMMEFITILLK